MSSIAYITDQKMIEFHRLHGNQNIVFWRPSSQKKFQSFHIGDYLFFLTKGTEKGKEREKGIIGYGRCYSEETHAVHQVWKRYGTMCGYGSETQFQEALIAVNKAHELPKQIHCLLLDRIMFFQAPIYLSEFAMNISKQIESYVYLNHDIAEQLLKKAMEIGPDMWNTNGEEGLRQLQQDQDIMMIQALHEQLSVDLYSAYEKKKLRGFAQSILMKQNGSFLSCGSDDMILWENGDICISVPCIMSLKHWKRHLLYCLAKAHLYQCILDKKGSSITVKIVMEEQQEEAIALCHLADISYQIIKNTE